MGAPIIRETHEYGERGERLNYRTPNPYSPSSPLSVLVHRNEKFLSLEEYELMYGDRKVVEVRYLVPRYFENQRPYLLTLVLDNGERVEYNAITAEAAKWVFQIVNGGYRTTEW